MKEIFRNPPKKEKRRLLATFKRLLLLRKRISPRRSPLVSVVHNPIEQSTLTTYIVPGLLGFYPLVLQNFLALSQEFIVIF